MYKNKRAGIIGIIITIIILILIVIFSNSIFFLKRCGHNLIVII